MAAAAQGAPDKTVIKEEIEKKKYDFGTFMENAQKFDIRKVPCARDALLHGIGGGMLLGALQFVRTRYIKSGVDFAIGGFLLISIADLEFCRYQRRKKAEDIKATIDKLNKDKAQRPPEQ